MSHLLLDLREVVLGDTENDGDRLKLSNDDERRGAVRLNDVARINEPQADPSVDWRSDVRIDQIYPRVIKQSLIVLNGALILFNGLFLIVDLLLRNCVLFVSLLIASE